MSLRAFVDANVLVPARLRDVLLTPAEVELYEIRWSAQVLDEVTRHLPSCMDAPARTSLFGAMARAFSDALVEWPASLWVEVPKLINAKDRHVAAAARRWLGGVEPIDTAEIRDRLTVWTRRELGSAVADLVARPDFIRDAR
ncbi:hypothetical protein ACFXG4_11070 [Nocardia sp. NPDC059246]|uniref:hypothetical protein n=1 Tax=unclassified Nocardia TaxID=2637762 RepID=UPI00367EFAAD